MDLLRPKNSKASKFLSVIVVSNELHPKLLVRM